MTLLTPADIEHAAHTLHGVAARTPAITSLALDDAAGHPVACKAENLQRTGSFKFRGAYHHTVCLPAETRAGGIIGASSGNHAQALALAARLLGTKATVVIPHNAPLAKMQGARSLGARLITYQRDHQDRDALVDALADRDGLAVVPSANSAHVMAGAGTAALELLTDHPDITTLVVPVGGGGLAAGSAVIAKHLVADIQIIGVEPESATDTQLSLREGRRMRLPGVPSTIADGLGHTVPTELPWQINSRYLADVVTVTEQDIRTAMSFAFQHLKLVVEPSGACALAAILSRRVPHTSGKIGVVISGGGVDFSTFQYLVSARRDPAHA